MNFSSFSISPEATRSYLTVALTILFAFILDNLLRSFIKVPKTFDNKRAQSYVTIFRNLITILVYAVALHIILAEVGVNITPLLASAGILGVIIGIGARAIIEDLLAGLFLLSQNSISVGDYIKVEDGIEGNIETIGFRTLTLRGGDGALYIIPNGMVKKVTNYSRTKATVTIDIPIKASQNIDTILKVAKEALDELRKDKELKEKILIGSKINGISNFQSSVPILMTIQAIIVTTPQSRWSVAQKYRYYVKKAFEKNKISFE